MVILHLDHFLVPNNLPKTFPKRGPDGEKITVKNDMRLNIDFFVFGLDFGGSWAFILEPRWIKMREKLYHAYPQERS